MCERKRTAIGSTETEKNTNLRSLTPIQIRNHAHYFSLVTYIYMETNNVLTEIQAQAYAQYALSRYIKFIYTRYCVL